MEKRLFIFIGGPDSKNGDYSMVHRLAENGRTAKWSSLKGVQPGDRVLIYISRPVSGLIAKAEVQGLARKGKSGDYAYRAKTGRFALLKNQVSLTQLKRDFPRWGWLRYPRGKASVPEEYAERLWELVHRRGAPKPERRSKPSGGGFGDADSNALVEKAAVRKVVRLLKQRGFKVHSREGERDVGYDLEANKNTQQLHVEVKGVSGVEEQFIITRAELENARTDRLFRLMVVTQAGTRMAKVHEYTGRELLKRFRTRPISYQAKPI